MSGGAELLTQRSSSEDGGLILYKKLAAIISVSKWRIFSLVTHDLAREASAFSETVGQLVGTRRFFGHASLVSPKYKEEKYSVGCFSQSRRETSEPRDCPLSTKTLKALRPMTASSEGP